MALNVWGSSAQEGFSLTRRTFICSCEGLHPSVGFGVRTTGDKGWWKEMNDSEV